MKRRPLNNSQPPPEPESIKLILARAATILEEEGNRNDMWGYNAIVRAVAELGFKSAGKEHGEAARLFVNKCNSAEMKIAAMRKVIGDLG